jgi:hypothetical protein
VAAGIFLDDSKIIRGLFILPLAQWLRAQASEPSSNLLLNLGRVICSLSLGFPD